MGVAVVDDARSLAVISAPPSAAARSIPAFLVTVLISAVIIC